MDTETPKADPWPPVYVKYGRKPWQELRREIVEELLQLGFEKYPVQFGNALREVIIGQNGAGR